MKFTYIDKENLCIYTDGAVQTMESAYITRYRELSIRDSRNKEWKKQTDNMMYDGFFNQNQTVEASVCALTPTLKENEVLYAFSVNETSGIYRKSTDDEKKTEAHFITSNDVTFQEINVRADGMMLGTVKRDFLTSDIAVFSKQGGDYKYVTGGDSLDEHPYLSEDGEILYNSYAIGRDMENNFVKYMPSELLKINTRSLQIETVLSDEKYSFVKPILDKEGNLYCIRKPGEEKEKSNLLLDIILIPVRLIQAIGGFLSMFVRIFTGKPLMRGKGKTAGGGSAAKNMDEQRLFLHNHMLNVEKELKKNAKSDEGGFIPHSWQLVRFKKTGADGFFDGGYDVNHPEELAKGVADFVWTEEGAVYTNGKRIYTVYEDNGEWKRKKLQNVDFCVKLGAIYGENKERKEDIFDSL